MGSYCIRADVDLDIPAIAVMGWQSAGKSSLRGDFWHYPPARQWYLHTVSRSEISMTQCLNVGYQVSHRVPTYLL
jgi:hypothetical protein